MNSLTIILSNYDYTHESLKNHKILKQVGKKSHKNFPQGNPTHQYARKEP